MPKDSRYNEQFSVVGTVTHYNVLEGVANEVRDSKALVVRYAVDKLFNLNDGKLLPGDTREAAIARVVAELEATGNLLFKPQSEASAV